MWGSPNCLANSFENHACPTSVDLLESVIVLLKSGGPYGRTTLKTAVGDGTAGYLTCLAKTVLQVPGDKLKGGVGLLGDMVYLVVL